MDFDNPLSPVLVAVDRGGSDAAVRYGTAEALRTSRPLELVHVAPDGDGWLALVGQDSLRVAVSHADAEVAGRVRVHGTVARGSVLVELTRAAARVSLLVMEQQPPAAHRRPEPATAAALAGLVDVPLTVVPAGWVDRGCKVVTVGLDPDAPDDAALRAAVALARLRSSTLRVLVAGSPDGVAERLARLGGDACDLVVEPVSGPAAEALRRTADSSDLVVVGRHHPLLAEGSRLGAVGRALLDDPVCPVLLTPPGHTHDRSGIAGAMHQGKETLMFARVGDRIVIRSNHVGGPIRDGEVLEVEHADGRPPYRVRWSDDGQESLFFPGPDAHIERLGPTYQPEYDLPVPIR